LVDDVRTYGWHVITVPVDEHGPGFTYSIGLFKSYDKRLREREAAIRRRFWRTAGF
jgi:hypothetical protein